MDFNHPCRYRYWTYTQLIPDPCKQSAYYGGFTTTVAPTDWKDGNTLPGWHKRVAMKQNAVTNYDRTVTDSISTDPYVWQQAVNVSCASTANKPVLVSRLGYTVPINALTNNVHGIPTDSLLLDQVVAKIRRRIENYDESYNALVPIGELRELHGLARGMVTTSRKLLATVSNISNGVHSKRALMRAVAAAGEAWLTWSFGLAPTIRDIASVCRALEAHNTRKSNQRLSATASKQWSTFETTNAGDAFGGAPIVTMQRSLNHKLELRLFVGLNPLVRSANNYAAASQALGLTPSNVVPALWQLLPWSWLLDYFGTLGDVIEDTFEADRPLIYSGLSTRYTVLERTVAKRITGGVLVHPGLFTARHFWHQRRTYSGALPRRVLRFKTADEVARGGVFKLLNLTSLLASKNAALVTRYVS